MCKFDDNVKPTFIRVESQVNDQILKELFKAEFVLVCKLANNTPIGFRFIGPFKIYHQNVVVHPEARCSGN